MTIGIRLRWQYVKMVSRIQLWWWLATITLLRRTKVIIVQGPANQKEFRVPVNFGTDTQILRLAELSLFYQGPLGKEFGYKIRRSRDRDSQIERFRLRANI